MNKEADLDVGMHREVGSAKRGVEGWRVDTAVLGNQINEQTARNEKSQEGRSQTGQERLVSVLGYTPRRFQARTHSGSLSSDIRHRGSRRSWTETALDDRPITASNTTDCCLVPGTIS